MCNICDLLGLFNPIFVVAKIIKDKNLWKLEIAWYESLSADICTLKWKAFEDQLYKVNMLKVARWIQEF